MVVNEDKRRDKANRMSMESEMLRVRDKSDLTGFFALQLAFAEWLGGISRRWKSRKNDRG
jgi:hypothetical protein